MSRRAARARRARSREDLACDEVCGDSPREIVERDVASTKKFSWVPYEAPLPSTLFLYSATGSALSRKRGGGATSDDIPRPVPRDRVARCRHLGAGVFGVGVIHVEAGAIAEHDVEVRRILPRASAAAIVRPRGGLVRQQVGMRGGTIPAVSALVVQGILAPVIPRGGRGRGRLPISRDEHAAQQDGVRARVARIRDPVFGLDSRNAHVSPDRDRAPRRRGPRSVPPRTRRRPARSVCRALLRRSRP